VWPIYGEDSEQEVDMTIAPLDCITLSPRSTPLVRSRETMLHCLLRWTQQFRKVATPLKWFYQVLPSFSSSSFRLGLCYSAATQIRQREAHSRPTWAMKSVLSQSVDRWPVTKTVLVRRLKKSQTFEISLRCLSDLDFGY
jgi:hypothetical protein